MTDEWKPTKELIEWAKGHFSQMNVGGLWMPEGSGLTYVKESDSKWRLQSILDSDEVRENHDRMKTLMWDVGVTVIDDSPAILPPPRSEEEAYLQEVTMKRDIAQSWADKDGTLLIDMGLENVYPQYIEDKEILLDNGETTNIEIWGYKATNPNTGEEIVIDPDDYHLLMGDQYFMRFCYGGMVWTALSREQMVNHIDEGKGAHTSAAGVGKKYIEGFNEPTSIPPWMWGTFCEFSDLMTDEEE